MISCRACSRTNTRAAHTRRSLGPRLDHEAEDAEDGEDEEALKPSGPFRRGVMMSFLPEGTCQKAK